MLFGSDEETALRAGKPMFQKNGGKRKTKAKATVASHPDTHLDDSTAIEGE